MKEGWQLAGALVRAERAELEDLRWIRSVRGREGRNFSIDGGKGRASGELSVTKEHGLDVSLAADFEDVRASWKASKWEANGSARFTSEGRPAGRAELDVEGLFGQTLIGLNGGVQLRDVRFCESAIARPRRWRPADAIERAAVDTVARGSDRLPAESGATRVVEIEAGFSFRGLAWVLWPVTD